MATKIDIDGFLGYRGTPYPMKPGVLNTYNQKTNYDDTEAVRREETSKTDILGRPIFQPAYLNEVFLDNAVIVIGGSNNIVSTPVSGRKGAVHELVNAEDYKITIRGAIVGNNAFPSEKLSKIHDLCTKGETLSIDSELTDIIEVDNVLVKDFRFPESDKTNVALYEITCISDFDYELIVE